MAGTATLPKFLGQQLGQPLVKGGNRHISGQILVISLSNPGIILSKGNFLNFSLVKFAICPDAWWFGSFFSPIYWE